MLVSTETPSPFRAGAELPETWPFSPALFREEFQRWPWYAFKDWVPKEEELACLFQSVLVCPTFRLVFPVAARPVVCRLPDEGTGRALAWLVDDVNYAGHIYWDEEGRVFANNFSDFMMTNLPEADAVRVFGRPLADMWAETCEDFDPGHYVDRATRATIKAFVGELKRSWTRVASA